MGVIGAADPNGTGGSDLSAVVLTAPGASDHATEGVFTGGLLFAVLLRPAVHFQLYRVIGIDVYDRLMGVGGMVLGQLTVVDQGTLGQVVLPEFGLEQKVAGIGVILENPGDGTRMPGESLLGKDTLLIQPLHNGGDALAVQEVRVDGSDDPRFLRNHDVLSIFVTVPQHESPPWLSVFKVLPYPPLLILAGGKTFLLSIACQDGKHQLSVIGAGVYVLLLKVHGDANGLQFPHRFQQGHGIPGHPGNGLGQDVVDLPGLAVGKQLLELFPAVLGAGLGLVGIDTYILPSGVAANVIAVVFHLGSQRVEHGILATGHSGICRYPLQLGL